jgi:hypothetical protein
VFKNIDKKFQKQNISKFFHPFKTWIQHVIHFALEETDFEKNHDIEKIQEDISAFLVHIQRETCPHDCLCFKMAQKTKEMDANLKDGEQKTIFLNPEYASTTVIVQKLQKQIAAVLKDLPYLIHEDSTNVVESIHAELLKYLPKNKDFKKSYKQRADFFAMRKMVGLEKLTASIFPNEKELIKEMNKIDEKKKKESESKKKNRGHIDITRIIHRKSMKPNQNEENPKKRKRANNNQSIKTTFGTKLNKCGCPTSHCDNRRCKCKNADEYCDPHSCKCVDCHNTDPDQLISIL